MVVKFELIFVVMMAGVTYGTYRRQRYHSDTHRTSGYLGLLKFETTPEGSVWTRENQPGDYKVADGFSERQSDNRKGVRSYSLSTSLYNIDRENPHESVKGLITSSTAATILRQRDRRRRLGRRSRKVFFESKDTATRSSVGTSRSVDYQSDSPEGRPRIQYFPRGTWRRNHPRRKHETRKVTLRPRLHRFGPYHGRIDFQVFANQDGDNDTTTRGRTSNPQGVQSDAFLQEDEGKVHMEARNGKDSNYIQMICIRCPRDHTVVIKRGLTCAVVPKPKIKPCSRYYALPSEIAVEISLGPQPGSQVLEGNYLMKFRIWIQESKPQTCQYRLKVKIKRCKALKPLVNGYITCSEGNQWGSRCHFYCHPGHTLTGSEVTSATCVGGEKEAAHWTHYPEPVCKEIPVRKKNMTTSTVVPTTSTVPSTTVISESTVTVQSTTLKPSTTTVRSRQKRLACRWPRAFPNTRVHCAGHRKKIAVPEGTSCEIHCRRGFTTGTNENPQKIVCWRGFWKGYKHLSCANSGCQTPPAIDKGRLSCSTSVLRNHHSEKSTCTYSCEKGYVIPKEFKPHSVIECSGDPPRWNQTVKPVCKSKKIPILKFGCQDVVVKQYNAAAVIPPLFMTHDGREAPTECSPNLVSRFGRTRVQCRAVDEELSTAVTCSYTFTLLKPGQFRVGGCTLLKQAQHSKLECSEDCILEKKCPINTVCRHICNEGFVIPVSQKHLEVKQCLSENDTWNVTEAPVCKKKRYPVLTEGCESLEVVMDVNRTTPVALQPPVFIAESGGIVEIRCSRRKLDQFGVFENACEATDLELGTKSSCTYNITVRALGCEVLLSDNFSQVSCSEEESDGLLPVATVCEYICQLGYVIPSSKTDWAMKECLHDGQWSNLHLRLCEEQVSPKLISGCVDMEITLNSSSSGAVSVPVPTFATANGEAAVTQCSVSNVSRAGEFQNVCQAEDEELRSLASCKFKVIVKESECPHLNPPANGRVKCRKTRGKLKCYFSCENGYQMPVLQYPLLERNFVECSRKSNTAYDFQEEYGIVDLPDCAREPSTTYLQGSVSFRGSVGNCSNYNDISKIMPTVKEFLYNKSDEPCLKMYCKNVTFVCEKSALRNSSDLDSATPAMKVVWTVNARYVAEDYDREVPLAETLLEEIQMLTYRLVTSDQELAQRLLEVGFDLWQDSFEQKPIILVCASRGFHLDPDSEQCEECPKGTFEEDGVCKSCPENYYQEKKGQTSCVPCPKQTVSLEGASSMDECVEADSLSELDIPEPARDAPSFDRSKNSLTGPCDPNPCAHGGECSIERGGTVCTCSVGYLGKFCHIKRLCNKKCQNGGTCAWANEVNSICICREGFAGRECQTELRSKG